MKTRSVLTGYALIALALIFIGACRDRREAGQKAGQTAAGKTEVAVGKIVGAVSADDKGGESIHRMPNRAGDTINAGDSISVGGNGSAMIKLTGGRQIALNSDTAVKVLSSTEIFLEKGEVWVEDAVGGTPGNIVVKTDKGEVDLKGAIAGLRFDGKILNASVVSGSATVSGTKGEALLRGGQEAIADSSGVRVVHIKDPSGLVSWTEGLRDVIEQPAGGQEGTRPPIAAGLGTLSAKVPGTKTLLPFEVLAQDVSLRIQDQVALTRIEQVFRNPTNRVVEGMYKFPVPAGARLNRYDMEIKGRMMRGEIVERQRGRAIMKTVIRQFIELMRDPALVEWESGSTFKTRIFPIQAKEKKRIVLSYIQTLAGAGGKYHYVLPVSAAGANAPRVPLFRIDATISSSGGTPRVSTPLYPTEIKVDSRQAHVSFEKRDFEPMVDFVVQIDQPERSEAAMVTYKDTRSARSGEDNWSYFMINLAPRLPEIASRVSKGSDWLLLVDTSQSRSALDLEIQKRLAASIISTLGSSDRVKVMAYDMRPRLMDDKWAAPSKEIVKETSIFLDSLMPAGATNIVSVLAEAARQMDEGRPSRVIMIGDGAATVGERRPGPLSELAARLFALSGASVTTIGVGSSVDSLLFEEISRRTGGRYQYLSSGEDLVSAAVRIITSLRVPTLETPMIAFEGLTVEDVYPKLLKNLGNGEELTIAGRYKGTGQLIAKLSGRFARKEWDQEYVFNVGEAKAANTFVPLVWASRKIDDLTLMGDERSVKETVALSKKYSIPSRYTSFIVLENEAMYREFRVGRSGDRFEWTGTEGIEYEQTEDHDLDAFDDVAGIGTAGSRGGGASGRSVGMRAAKMSAPRERAPMRKKAASFSNDPLSGLDAEVMYRPSRRRCLSTYSYEASVWRIPREPKEKDRKTTAKLKARIEKAPLERKHRKNYVKHLIRMGMYEEAGEAVAKWREMDGSNPTVIIYAADLMRLAGDIEDALRIYSGVLDVKPEDRKTLEMLASYLESKNRWSEAYPYRVSLNLNKPKDWKAAARRAITAAKAELWDEAVSTVRELVEEDRRRALKLKPGVRLPGKLKEAVLRIAVREKPSLLFEASSRSDVRSAKFAIELEWNAAVNLDLWVSTRRNRYLGCGVNKAFLIDGRSGNEGEVFYMQSAAPGRYRVQVLCAEPAGCGNVSGKVKIRAHGARRTIPFVLNNGIGTDLASIYVERWRARCGR